MKTISFKNRKGQVVVVGYSALSETPYNKKHNLKSLIDHLIIDGKKLGFTLYTPAESEKEIKSTAIRLMRNRKAYITNNAK